MEGIMITVYYCGQYRDHKSSCSPSELQSNPQPFSVLRRAEVWSC